MKCWHLFLLSLLFSTSASADFSNAAVRVHPPWPGPKPFILEIYGLWPTDCHPGKHKPVFSDYTGDSMLIEFETIIEPVVCNSISTPFRILVDMSDVIGTVDGEFGEIDTVLRFGNSEFEGRLRLNLPPIASPPPPWDRFPESGLYGSQSLEKQGLLIARQNQRMAMYPLVYDELGSSEWLFSSGGLWSKVYFGDLYELMGGQCLGCPLPLESPQLNSVGKISMLIDSEGIVQIKINDGKFIAYEHSEFGYGSSYVGKEPNQSIPDFSGRWALVEDVPSYWAPGKFGTEVLPLMIDIQLESEDSNLPSRVANDQSHSAGNVVFSITDTSGNKLAQMGCTYKPKTYEPYLTEMVCDLSNPDINNGNTIYNVRAASVEKLYFNPVTWIEGFSTRSRTAVRVD